MIMTSPFRSHKNVTDAITICSVSRILFVMPEPGHLRMYATTVLALASRGHEVILAYDNPDKGSRDGVAFKGAPPTLSTVGPVPAHGGPWREALIELGCTIDYVRFLSRRDGTPYLRGRMDKYLPARAASLRLARTWPTWLVRLLARLSALVERAVPVDPALTAFLDAHSPDAMVITPLVLRGPGGVQQTELVKAARVRGIPVALAVGSWDHLSSKGFIRVDPDMVLVWNDIQKREAVEMHGIHASRVVVTGAQVFDLWFGRQPSLDRGAFLARVGLPVDRPVILYAGSSRGIANPTLEIAFVRRWLTELRRSPDPAVRTAAVLVRPHLSNVVAWAGVDLSAFGAVSIWPRQRPMLPMNEVETADYFHSLCHSAAVVGINTSAMIEASIIGRPVLTVQVPEFADTQAGTTHFRYLIPSGGGSVESAETFEAHVTQLSQALANPGAHRQARERFIVNFVRPRGLETPALEAVVEALEGLTSMRPRPLADAPAVLAPLRWALRWLTRRASTEGVD